LTSVPSDSVTVASVPVLLCVHDVATDILPLNVVSSANAETAIKAQNQIIHLPI
jgi:hypothetical protein